MIFSDPNYEIPRLTAFQVLKELSNASNRPLLVRGVLQDSGKKIDCVLKQNGGERMGNDAILRELLAAFMAQIWGIAVVNPVLVEVTEDFISTAQGKPYYESLQRSLGWNFGSIYLDGYAQVVSGEVITGHRLKQAQKIAAFDLILQNTDRRINNPNLLTNGGELVIIDHELSFSFTRLLFSQGDLYRLQRDHWIDEMLLLPLIRRNPPPDIEILNFLNQIGPDFWEKVNRVVPANFTELPELVKIRSYFEALKSNEQEFLRHLKIAAFP